MYIGDDTTEHSNVILIKILSKDYSLRVTDYKLLFPTKNNNNNYETETYTGLKVLYRIGNVNEINIIDECRLPLLYDELITIERLLSHRQNNFGYSSIKNFNISCLFL